ncbi:hypothetical protein D3273_17585 [Lichenibacterium minor]|uniref:Uncharacterized protein n=1 Tax=Lichenibacterium minor TaxID=2316528 RepID=A0A4Q2U2C7_9HYPH|nr:DUF2268 domain-containing putative Zn-dependent protease [Lichenibacterium minor]RYC30659.1 hypothetical protein D3273_17585 [Lichenibacterium minor]
MTVEVAVFNAARLLPPPLEAEIRAGIDDALAALRQHLDVEDAGIVVLLAEGVDAETGMGGRAYGPDACEIRVDEASPALRVGTRVNAASVTVHELHHILRMRHGVPRRFADLCAGDVIVLEGLATQCQTFLGYPDPSIVRGITAEQVAPLLDRIAPIVGDPRAAWAWIYDPSGLPAEVHKAVYPMGHHVVGRYLARRGLTPLEAVGVPWREVWDAGLPVMG